MLENFRANVLKIILKAAQCHSGRVNLEVSNTLIENVLLVKRGEICVATVKNVFSLVLF